MKINIIATGSNCNCVLATFSNNEDFLFDFGKNALKKCLAAGYKPAVKPLITHSHADHYGDFELVKHLPTVKNTFPHFEISTIKVEHDVPNYGYFVKNTKTNEAFVYLVDFHNITDDNLNILKDFLIDAYIRDTQVVICMELSYCQFLFEKIDEQQRMGLCRHLSDFKFYHFFKMFKNWNKNIKGLTLHASNRKTESYGEMCPKDYIKQNLLRIFQSDVYFGAEGGLIISYNFSKNVENPSKKKPLFGEQIKINL